MLDCTLKGAPWPKIVWKKVGNYKVNSKILFFEKNPNTVQFNKG